MLTHGCIACSNCLWKSSLISAMKTVSSRCAMFLIEEASEFIRNPDQMANGWWNLGPHIEWVKINYTNEYGEVDGKQPLKMNKHTHYGVLCMYLCTHAAQCVHFRQFVHFQFKDLNCEPKQKQQCVQKAQPPATTARKESNHFYKMALVCFLWCAHWFDYLQKSAIKTQHGGLKTLFGRSMYASANACVCVREHVLKHIYSIKISLPLSHSRIRSLFRILSHINERM